jgi:hypothetical protein
MHGRASLTGVELNRGFERPLAFYQLRDQRIGGQPVTLPHLQKIDERGTGGCACAKLDAGVANALVQLRHTTPSPSIHFGGRKHNHRTGAGAAGFKVI